jgi:putative membrane protein
MIFATLAVPALLYAWGLREVRARRRRFPLRAVLCFFAGLATLAGALAGPMNARADVSFSWHMAQHLALTSLAAPLLLLGAPLRLALSSLPQRCGATLAHAFASRPMRVLMHPAVAWLQFAAVLYVSHFSQLYELALENEPVHALLHLVYLCSALLFWTPILAVAPFPHAPVHAVRLLALFLALPMSAFLGFAFYVTNRVLYPHYAGLPGAMYDQMNAGAVMWMAGGAPILVALLWVVADWGARERRFETIAESRT